MKKIILILFLFALTIGADDQRIHAENSTWFVQENTLTDKWPASEKWQEKTFKNIIIPEYKGEVPELKNFALAENAFPKSLDMAISPPFSGIQHIKNGEIVRVLQYIQDKGWETDSIIEYQLLLSGRWGLQKEFQTKDYLFNLTAGDNNWIEIIIGNKIVAANRASLIVDGSIFNTKEPFAIIKCTSVDRSNKGLVDVSVFKPFEHFIADPFSVALKEKWWQKDKSGKSSVKGLPTAKWQIFDSKAIQQVPWLPETFSSLFRRTYQCPSEASTKNIFINVNETISHVWINEKEIDLDTGKVPDGLLRQGDNEIIYYSSETSGIIKNNLNFEAIRPYWLKTEVTASASSVVSGLLRGAVAKVYINGQYAGIMHAEKEDEFLGAGLFQQGKNEVALCILQNNKNTFLEHLIISEANKDKALVLPWKTDDKEYHCKNPGLSPFSGYYLTFTGNRKSFSATFKRNSLFTENCELIFDSGKRFSGWMFKNQLHAPYTITLNGQLLKRTGHSFVIPKDTLQDNNTISFSSNGTRMTAPLLYLSSQATAQRYAKLKLINKQTSFIPKPGLYQQGDSLSYLIDVDYSTYPKVVVDFNGVKTEHDAKNARQGIPLNLELKKIGPNNLSVTLVKENGEKKAGPSQSFNVIDPVTDLARWLQDNRLIKDITLSNKSFLQNESTLFPESFQEEWTKRERMADGDSLEFSSVRSWFLPKKFDLFSSLPNGVPTFEKFIRRLQIYLKLESRGYPVNFTLVTPSDTSDWWNSAAFTFQYLLWLEKKKIQIDWSLETLKDYQETYVKKRPKDVEAYVKLRREAVVNIIKKMLLNAAPHSTFKEVNK